jgi:hypothetical protein
MAQPTYAQLKNLTQNIILNETNATGELSETLAERLLTCLAIMASGVNPDGSAWAGFPASAASLNSVAGNIANIGTTAAGVLTTAPRTDHIHAINVTGNNMASDTGLSTTVATTVVSTPSLGVGVWTLFGGCTVLNGNASVGTLEGEIVLGTALGSALVGQSAETEMQASLTAALTFFCLFSVTQAGTLSLSLKAPGASASTAKASTLTSAFPNATYLMAMRTG